MNLGQQRNFFTFKILDLKYLKYVVKRRCIIIFTCNVGSKIDGLLCFYLKFEIYLKYVKHCRLKILK